MVLTTKDVEWLAEHYPTLVPSEDLSQIVGDLSFSAAYDEDNNDLSIIRSADDTPLGIVLTGTYPLLIKGGSADRLPKTYVTIENYPRGGERHFTISEAACLCGPSEEVHLIKGGMTIGKYIEELVIPFLYGQRYYDEYGKWPLPAYEHNTVGALQSYYQDGDPDTVGVTVATLRGVAKEDWPRIREMLVADQPPTDQLPCLICAGADPHGCHPEAWEGFKKLHNDLKASGLPVPE